MGWRRAEAVGLGAKWFGFGAVEIAKSGLARGLFGNLRNWERWVWMLFDTFSNVWKRSCNGFSDVDIGSHEREEAI